MKDTDKVTLTFGQLKKLVKESKRLNEGSLYMGCHVYRVGSNWVIYDEENKQLVAKISNYDFKNGDVNEFDIIRKWRETHPSRQ